LKRSWTHLITPFTFSRSGWSVVRGASLAKEGTSKKRPSPYLYNKVLTRSNKVSPRTFQTALVTYKYRFYNLEKCLVYVTYLILGVLSVF
jgi:hypothetical protein